MPEPSIEPPPLASWKRPVPPVMVNWPEKVTWPNAALAAAVAGGFNASRAIDLDPWLDSLRASPGFAAVKRDAAARYRRAVAAFQQAHGEEVLGSNY
jgi:hypothetical protein